MRSSSIDRARALVVALLCTSACHTSATRPQDGRPRELGTAEIAALIDPKVAARPAWAEAIDNALRTNGRRVDQRDACAVIAIVAQESGFQADPAVPGLAKLVEARLEAARGRLGPLGRPVIDRLLAGHSPDDARSFADRLARVRTERDVDVTFRDLLTYHRNNHPGIVGALGLGAKLFDVDELEDLNPITTAGPMQVSVRFAEQWARDHKGRPEDARDALYTRKGGVYYGTARLFGHEASYPEMLFRFADYNAGVYASRNAAVQDQLARLTGQRLVLDGDLLAYDRNGAPVDDDSSSLRALLAFRERFAPDLSERRVRQDVRKEKSVAFERTDTYRAIGRVYAQRFGRPADYAIVPDVEIDSPKLRGKRSTAWFARGVDRRFQTCLQRSP